MKQNMCNYFLAVNFLLLFLAGCAPGLGAKIPLNDVAAPVLESDSPLKGTTYCLEYVRDLRPSETVVFIAKRPVEATTEVAQIVTQHIEESLMEAGVLLSCKGDYLNLRVQVIRWLMSVEPSFPYTDAYAVATLQMEILDNVQPLFNGSYQGSVDYKHIYMREVGVVAVLKEALQEASKAFLLDPKLSAIRKTSR